MKSLKINHFKFIYEISLKFKLGKYNNSNSNLFLSNCTIRFFSLVKTTTIKNFSENPKSNSQNHSKDIISTDELSKKEKVRDITSSSIEEKSINSIY